MLRWIVLALALAVTYSAKIEIVKPRSGKNAVGLIIISGNGIQGEQYKALAEAVQQTEDDASVFVAITSDYANLTVTEDELVDTVKESVKRMQRQGLNAFANVFVAAHSASAQVLEQAEDRLVSEVKGSILLGARVTKQDQTDKPTLFITGELDGITTIFEVAEQYRDKLPLAEDSDPQFFQNAMAVVKGMNHGVYITGRLPEDLFLKDLETGDGDDTVGLGGVASVISAFIVYNNQYTPEREKEDAALALRGAFLSMRKQMGAIVEMLEQERMPDLESGTYCPWVETAQKIVSTLPDTDLENNFVNADKAVDELQWLSAKPTSDFRRRQQLFAVSVSKLEDFGADEDLVSLPQIEAKMVSREGLIATARRGRLDLGFDFEDETCRAVNERAVREAYYRMSDEAKDRFDAKDFQIEFVDDLEFTDVMDWYVSDLEIGLKNETETTTTPSTTTRGSTTTEFTTTPSTTTPCNSSPDTTTPTTIPPSTTVSTTTASTPTGTTRGPTRVPTTFPGPSLDSMLTFTDPSGPAPTTTPSGSVPTTTDSSMTIIQVRSPIFKSRSEHNCKLLSPARAMEFMYVEALRRAGI